MAKNFFFPESVSESEAVSLFGGHFPKPFSVTSNCPIVFKFCIRLLQTLPWGQFFCFFEFRFPSLEKNLEKQSKISDFYGSVGT